MKRKESFTISFRLDKHYLAKLNDKAREGESLHERARRLLLDALDDEGTEEIKEELSEVSQSVGALRDDLALAVEALLITAGEFPKEQAKEWVSRNLRAR